MTLNLFTYDMRHILIGSLKMGAITNGKEMYIVHVGVQKQSWMDKSSAHIN